jgi:hypothetical protein
MMIVNANLAFDAQRAAIAKLNGGLDTYAKELGDGMNQATKFGLSLQQFGEGFLAVQEGLTQLNTLSARSRQNLSNLASQMKILGMDSFVQNVETGIQVLGMTADRAGEVQKELLGLGSALGPKFKKMIDSEFGPAMASLSAHTRNKAIKVFKELAVQSRITGLELSKLQAFAEQFDTFEGSAEIVGKLNAALGGNYFNSLELLRASESERVKMIREGIALSGRRFKDLSRFEQKFAAQALGVSSVAEAHKLLRTETQKEADELAKLTAQGLKFNLSAEQMRQRVANTRSAKEKLNQILQNLLVVFTPLILKVNEFLTMLAKTIETTKEGMTTFGQYAKVLGIVALGLVAIKGTLFLISKAGGLIGGLLGFGGKAATGGLLASLKPAAVAIGAIALAMVAIGGAMMVFGPGLKAMGEGLDAIGPVFKKYGALTLGGQLVGFLSSLVVSSVAGLGLVSLAVGVSLVGKSIKELGDNLKAIPTTTNATLNFKTNINAQELQPKVTIDFKNLDQSKKKLEDTVNDLVTKVGMITKRMGEMTS